MLSNFKVRFLWPIIITATKTTTTPTTTFLGCDSIEINLVGYWTQNFPWVFVSTSTDLLISSDSMSLGLTNKSSSIHENLTWYPLSSSFCNKCVLVTISAQKNSSILYYNKNWTLKYALAPYDMFDQGNRY